MNVDTSTLNVLSDDGRSIPHWVIAITFLIFDFLIFGVRRRQRMLQHPRDTETFEGDHGTAVDPGSTTPTAPLPDIQPPSDPQDLSPESAPTHPSTPSVSISLDTNHPLDGLLFDPEPAVQLPFSRGASTPPPAPSVFQNQIFPDNSLLFNPEPAVDSVSPQYVPGATPSWAAQLWDAPSSSRMPSSTRHSVRTEGHLTAVKEKTNDAPLKPVLKPPMLAPSAWQLYFTDWIRKRQASGTWKPNIAQAAREAGQEYANLSLEEKEPYKRRSQSMKEARERELNAYIRSLTPDDIKRENASRAAQRKAAKSRKGNIKGPNAPKKPLGAYFMFLQSIRANSRLVRDVSADETETTKQSVLAAANWRSMTDAERQPFLSRAEQEKMDYRAARKLYEEGTTGLISSINFSILPSPALSPAMKMELESDSEDFSTDDGFNQPNHS